MTAPTSTHPEQPESDAGPVRAPRSLRRLAGRAGTLGVVLLAAVIAAQDGPFYRVEPGPAVPASQTLRTLSAAPGNPAAGDPLVTTVAAHQLSNLEAAWCGLRTGCTVLTVPDGGGGQHPGVAQMTRSLDHADTAATVQAAGAAAWPQAPGRIAPDGSILGPSAGLSYALYLLSARVEGDLFAGRTVAATGTVAADGAVGPVGGVTLKAAGAAAAGAQVFFVPAAEADQLPADPGLEVVPVRTVDDAVTWLCDHGATSGLCATAPAGTPGRG